MLNIPEAIKDQFKKDGVLKNIRIVFPNGEHSDISNDRLIKESLKFDESISSREVIKWGLCESSQISFECVGIDDITGLEIFVYIEIDVTGTNVSGRTADDVPFPFYPVPLGKFIVDEAKLDSKMFARKITAYSQLTSLPVNAWWTTANWIATDRTQKIKGKTLDFNVMNFILSSNNNMFRLTYSSVSVLSGWEHLSPTGTAMTFTIPITSVSGNTYDIVFTAQEADTYYCEVENFSIYTPWGSLSDLGVLNRYKLSSSYDSSVETVIQALQTGGVTDEDVLDEVRYIIDLFSHFNPANFYKTNMGFAYVSLYNDFRAYGGDPLKVDDVFMLPPYLTVFTRLGVGYGNAGGNVTYLDSISNVTVAKVDVEYNEIDYNNFTVKLDPELLEYNEINSIGIYSFFKSVMFLDMRKLFESCVELLGCMGRMGRDGYFEFVSLAEVAIDGLFPADNLYPDDDLYPKEYGLVIVDESQQQLIENDSTIDLWFDRKFIGFRGLTCEYTSSEVTDDDGNPVQMSYQTSWSNNNNLYIYDVSNNEIIKNNTWTADGISAILAPLIAALKKVMYYPAEVSMVGLPYIEAGDEMLVNCHGHQLLVLNLSRTLDGIQALRDKVKTD